VAGAMLADTSGTTDTGAVYVFAGGALSGTVNETAALTVSGANTGDQIGLAVGWPIQCCDVTGDGTPDVVVAAMLADVGATTDAGAIYVWAGGSTLTGGVQPTATCTVTGATLQDQLGSSPRQSVVCRDVTGDGTLDLLAGAVASDGPAFADIGHIYLFAGGTGLSGAVTPTATLTRSTALTADRLTQGGGQGILCCDVTGDGILDVIGVAPWAFGSTTAPFNGPGRIYVWAGGTGLTGSVNATAELAISGGSLTDQLGTIVGDGVRCVDVTGDGTTDLVVGATFATIGATNSAGGVWVWAGGGSLTGQPAPTASLLATGATAFDQMGSCAGQGIVCADITGDGVPDVIAGGSNVDVAAVANAGAAYLWVGGSAIGVAPVVMTVAGATANDELGR